MLDLAKTRERRVQSKIPNRNLRVSSSTNGDAHLDCSQYGVTSEIAFETVGLPKTYFEELWQFCFCFLFKEWKM